jgi:peptidoglycan/xylan/chitin deacetylase (PgdA/CDA1 family)
MISIVVDGSAGGSRDLVRTADAAARQSVAVELLVATAGECPVIPSLTARLGAEVHRASNRAAAINAAVTASNHEFILVVPVPWLVRPELAASCARSFATRADTTIVLSGLEMRTADGLVRETISCTPGLPSLLANPLATPAVFAVRRSVWQMVGGLDERLGDLAPCEWWFRVLAQRCEIVATSEPLAALEASERSWWPPVTGGVDSTQLRAVLQKHRPLLEAQLSDLVVRLEIASGVLIREHRAQLAHRDRALGELEGIRARIAHHRAFIEHHAQSGLDWGDFRRADPLSRNWGYDRGVPVDRRYIEDFLASHSSDIAGAVLEVQEDDFTRRFGGRRVTSSDVVDVDDTNRRATIFADLRAVTEVSDGRFDAIVLTQTLHVIDDATAVLRECWRLLKPGGVLLATLPSASRVCLEYGAAGDLWRVTNAGARTLFESVFGPSAVDVTTYGNVLTNVAFLQGLACSELSDEEFETADPYHPLLIGVRAQKPDSGARRSTHRHGRGVVLLYHRIDDRPDVHDLSVPEILFEQQLSWLTRECHVLPLEELLSGARHGLPDRAVALTFDDGYVDTLDKALPVLERLGVPATVFATTQWLDAPGEYWWDALERALILNDSPASLTIQLDGGPVTFATGTPDERRGAHTRLHDRLVHASLVERDRVMGEIGAWCGLAPDSCRRPLLRDELRRLASSPVVSIGAHTVHHLALPDQDSHRQAREVVDSMRGLERVIGRRVDVFAHPYGAVDRVTANLARETCRWAAGCQGTSLGCSFDAANFPRIEVKRWEAESLIGRLAAYLDSQSQAD